MFTRLTSYDVDPMNSLTLKNVLSIANSEKESVFKRQVKPQSGSGKVLQIFANYVGDKIGKILSPTDKITPICKWVSGYM